MTPLRLGTRSSQLALWQARTIRSMLQPILPQRSVELVLIETHGDRDQQSRLAHMGGFGVFTKAIQDGLLDDRCDIAVHSLKDLPTIPVPGLQLSAVPQRGATGDALISRKVTRFDDLPSGATVGTSSLRRRAQILHRRPDLNLIDLRGNVETRLRKLTEQNLDAIVLAQAGLERLGLASEITEILDPAWMFPAVGQGAIGLECRSDDTETIRILSAINHPETYQRVLAERSMLFALGGGCLVPIGARTEIVENQLHLSGAVLSADGKSRIERQLRGQSNQPDKLGQELAQILLDAGAKSLLLN